MPALASVTALPTNAEAVRQLALDRYGVLDTDAEAEFDDIASLAAAMCDVPAAVVAFIDRDRVWFKSRIGIDQAEIPRALSLADALIARPQLLVVNDMAADVRGSSSPLRSGGRALRCVALAPLLGPRGQVLGAIAVGDVNARPLTTRQREGLQGRARHTVRLLDLRLSSMGQRRLAVERGRIAERAEQARAELQDKHEQLLDSARRDGLTGLLNRAALAQFRADPIQMQRFADGTSSLLLIDIDHFKQVNDRHGHLLGDRALRVVADAVSASVRETDVAVRFGGEEFLVALPQTGLAHAVEVAHRIRDRVAEASLPFPLTISVGIAAGHPSMDRAEQVFERADQALYRAKAAGRDRIVVDDTPRL